MNNNYYNQVNSTGLNDVDSYNINNYNNISCIGSLNVSSNSTFLSFLNVGGDISCSGLSVFASISSTTGSILTQLYNLSTNTGLITPNNISLTGYNPTYSLGGGSLIGYCNTNGSVLSTTAIIGDSVFRAATGSRLILQSGAGSAGLYLDSSNNVVLDNPSTCLSTLNVSGNSVFNNNVSINGVLTCTTMDIITTELITGATTMDSTLFVSGSSIFQNATTCLSSLAVSGNSTFTSSIFMNGNDNKVLSFDAAGYGRLGFLKQFGTIPKICAGTGYSIVFSHLNSGDLIQSISTGLTVLDRMTINTNGNVGIGIGNASALFHVSGTTILNNITTLNNTLTVSGNTILNSALTCLNTLTISGNTILNSALTCLNNLLVSGNTILNSATTCLNNLNVSGTFTCNILNTISNELITGATTMDSTLFVSGTTILQNAATCESTLTIASIAFVGYNNNNPYVQLGNINGNNYGVASTPGNFSTSAATGDTILRSINNLLLQSGTNAAGLVINSSNNTMIYNNLNVSGTTNLNNNFIVSNTYGIIHNGPIIPLSTVDSNLYGGCAIYNAFAGDSSIYSYWGVSINLNNAGNNPSSNAGYARIPYTSSFTINQRPVGGGAGSALTNLFTVLQNGNVGIGTTSPPSSLYVSGTTVLNNAATLNSSLNLANNTWHNSVDGVNRFYYNNNGTSFFHSGNANGSGFTFRNTAQADIFTINDSGTITANGTLNIINSYSYLYGLRISGNDGGNTIYNASNSIGISAILPSGGSAITFNTGTSLGTLKTVIAIDAATNQTTYYGPINIYNGTYNSIWQLSSGTSYTGVNDSLIFQHVKVGTNSTWWFNGSQQSTQSEISDSRVKTDINDISNALNIINQLNPKTYNKLDDKDKFKQFGFIAQDVEKVIPEIVNTESEYIANVYSDGTYNNKIITVSKNIRNILNIGDKIKTILNNDGHKEYLVGASNHHNRNKKRISIIKNIIDDYSFEVEEEIKMNENDNNIFVYGVFKEDFKTLDYNSLFSINFKATKELYNIINDLQERIKILENKLI